MSEKTVVSRQEVSDLLVEDVYFEKGHLKIKLFQSTMAIIGWLGVILPFIWLLIPVIFPKAAQKTHFFLYKEELTALKFLLIFLSLSFFAISLTYILLTFRNNYRFKHSLQNEKLYDEERLDKQRELLNDVYTERFGTKEFRQSVKFYSVKEEQNFDTSFIKELYKKGNVDL
ncbi:hypothetical protein IGI37_003749 [Enterococcus sp. AZ194]|uniref:cell division protein n=1 Tax=Enterococcus sp. AZ194 TaxID=2774629 RepID=UPI003F1FF630